MKWLWLLFLLPAVCSATYISGAYVNDGGDKIPRPCRFPHCLTYSSSTYSAYWNGITATPFCAKNQTCGFQVIAYNQNAIDADSVTVNMSSWTCGSSGIVSTVVSSANVTDTTTRPTQVFFEWDDLNQGMSNFPFLGNSDSEERVYPSDMRTPYTVSGGGQGAPTGGTNLWTNRTFANMFIPVALIPNEEISPSSYTVYASSSAGWYVDTYVSSAIPTGQCTATFSIYEGATLSTAIPISMQVFNVTLPTQQSLPVIGFTGGSDINKFVNGNAFPSTPVSGQYLASRKAFAQMLRQHGIIEVGDSPDTATNNFPSLEYSSHTSGEIYTTAAGYGNARFQNLGDNYYGISWYGGAFGVNWSTSAAVSGPSNFCTRAAAYQAYCNANGINCILYTPLDETTGALMSTEIASMTYTLANTPACSSGGKHLSFMQTGNLPIIVSSAPYTDLPASAENYTGVYLVPSTYFSSTTWQVDASSIMAGNGSAGSAGRVWRYNDTGHGGTPPVYPPEADGYGPEAMGIALWKKLCYDGTCHGGWYSWQTDYYTDSNFSTRSNDLYHHAVSFGNSNGPNSSAVFGDSGSSYSQLDGVLVFPGTDQVNAGAPVAFNGAVATYNIKNVRRMIDDIDIFNMAYGVNRSSMTALAQTMVPQAFWEAPCHEATPGGDCSYYWGDQGWAYGANNFTNARYQALEMASEGTTQPIRSISIGGQLTIMGGVSIQ